MRNKEEVYKRMREKMFAREKNKSKKKLLTVQILKSKQISRFSNMTTISLICEKFSIMLFLEVLDLAKSNLQETSTVDKSY